MVGPKDEKYSQNDQQSPSTERRPATQARRESRWRRAASRRPARTHARTLPRGHLLGRSRHRRNGDVAQADQTRGRSRLRDERHHLHSRNLKDLCGAYLHARHGARRPGGPLQRPLFHRATRRAIAFKIGDTLDVKAENALVKEATALNRTRPATPRKAAKTKERQPAAVSSVSSTTFTTSPVICVIL